MFANLSLDNYFFPEVVVKANPDFNSRVKNRVAEIGIERSIRRHQSNPAKYLVELRITVFPGAGKNKRRCPIIADVTARGHFRFIKLPKTEEEIAKFIMLNAVAILYGLIRAQVAQISSIGPHGRFVLPTVDFIEMLKKVHRGEQPSPKGKRRPTKKPSKRKKS